MGDIVEVKTRRDLSQVSNGFTGYGGVVKMDTTDERVYAFNNAEKIVDSVFKRERQGAISLIRSETLMAEKKSIMGDLWNANKTHVPEDFSKKWENFIKKLDKVGGDNVAKLLKFADYHETAKLNGVKYTAPNQGQFNALATLVNKQTKTKGLTPVVRMYDALVKTNNGKEFGSAKEVVEAYEKFTMTAPPKEKPKQKEEVENTEEKRDIYLEHIFIDIVGECPKTTDNPMSLPNSVVKELPNISKDEWKHFYRESAKIFHSDKGGTGFEILGSLNNAMNIIFKHIKEVEARDTWREDYKEWKSSNGFEDDFITQTELDESGVL